ncbi:MAG TPA: DUF72 domain-containing protein [Allosphingosinicella sp.]|uniref:DUF72 domain-containing protein n=1 Tax=Allosphingosinicella sp. TaxID=2823234 RepID=UPI002ED7A020
MTIIIGTAGWTIPSKDARAFGQGDSALARYATRFRGVEINSSFHRPHRKETWQRWAETVPEDFQFAVKLPKTITHGAKLVDCEGLLETFLSESASLGPKFSVLLVQLPPSLAFDAATAEGFFKPLAERGIAAIACEPRHASWFAAEADALLESWKVHRVAADPARTPNAGEPGGWRGISYYRLHGSPVMYRSSYDDARLAEYAAAIRKQADRPVWCMFDNTASSAATANALTLDEMT